MASFEDKLKALREMGNATLPGVTAAKPAATTQATAAASARPTETKPATAAKDEDKKNVFERLADAVNYAKEARVRALENTADYYRKQATENPDTRTWLQKGTLSDGYQFGDVSKGVAASVGDLAENAGAGIIGLGEKFADAATQLGAWSYGGLKQSNPGAAQPSYSFSLEDRDKEKQAAQEFISKDLYDEKAISKKIVGAPSRWLGLDTEAQSFLGEKTDALAESGGQLAGTALAQLIGVPWFLTTGLSSFGGALEEAYNEGADFNEAGTSAAIAAAAETLSEKLAGGIKFGGKTLDDFVTDKLSKAITDKALRIFSKTAWGALGEGGEEVLSGFLSAIGKRLTYADDKTLAELFTKEEAMESFISGVILGGGIGLANNIKTDVQPDAKPAANKPEILPSAPVSQQTANDMGETAQPATAYQGAPGFEAGAEAMGDDGLGAANAGFTTNEGAQVPTQNKTITDSPYLTEEERARFAPGTHERISEAESVNRAQQNFYTDSEGNIVNLDYTVDDLLSKDAWTGVDQDTAQIAMMELVRRARKSGDYSKVEEFGEKIEAIGATEAGRSLQARKKWVAKNGTNIVAAAVKATSGGAKTKQAQIIGTVAELAEEYDNVLKGEVKPKRSPKPKQKVDYVDEVDTVLDAKREVEGLVELIRRTAEIRKTAGLRNKGLSKSQTWALKHLAENGEIQFLRDFAANGILNIATDAQSRTAGEWITTIRRNALLDKVSSVMRNLVSNGVFDFVDTVARDISVPLDIALSKRTKTRSVAIDKGFISEAKRKGTLDGLAKSLLEVGLDVDATGNLGRYESTSNRTAKMSGGVVSRLFSTWEKFSGYAFVTTDAAAKGGTQAEVQRGIDELYNRGLIKDDSLMDAGETEAKYRTFQDDTKLSNFTLGLRQKANENFRIGGEKGIGLGDIIMPFAKTPTNLATRALEYSPAGLVKSAKDFADIFIKAGKGEVTAAEQAKAVQGLGRGVTGTGLITIATVAALSGCIKSMGAEMDDDDKDRQALAKMAGEYGTQFNPSSFLRVLSGGNGEWQDGDVLLNIGFLEPINAHLTVGALLAEDIKEEGRLSFKDLAYDSVEGAFRSIMEMPLMSSFREIAETFEYAEGDTYSEKALNTAAQYAANQTTSIIPNALKGIAQGTDPYQRDMYSSDTVYGQLWDNVKAAIPGLRQTLPAKTDSFGRPMETEGGVLGFMNSNVLPGYVTHYKEQPGASVLDRLYELTGSAAAYPDRKPPDSLETSIQGKKYELELDSEAAEKYQQRAGERHMELLEAVEDSGDFAGLSTDQQRSVVEAARNKSKREAEAKAFADANMPYEESAKDKVESRMNAYDYIDWLISGEKQTIPANYGRNPDWQNFERAAEVLPSDLALDMMYAYNESAAKKVDAAMQNGVSMDDAVAYYRAVTAKNDEGKAPTKAEVNRRIAALGFDNLTRGALMRAFKDASN